jgi:hypothetical protein
MSRFVEISGVNPATQKVLLPWRRAGGYSTRRGFEYQVGPCFRELFAWDELGNGFELLCGIRIALAQESTRRVRGADGGSSA